MKASFAKFNETQRKDSSEMICDEETNYEDFYK
jgi:hypothetical protein